MLNQRLPRLRFQQQATAFAELNQEETVTPFWRDQEELTALRDSKAQLSEERECLQDVKDQNKVLENVLSTEFAMRDAFLLQSTKLALVCEQVQEQARSTNLELEEEKQGTQALRAAAISQSIGLTNKCREV